MSVSGDLSQLQDVLLLFDFTRNEFAQAELRLLFATPSSDRDAIMERQAVLKGFIGQLPILGGYSYARFDLNEVHDFLSRLSDPAFLPTGILAWRFLNKASRQLLKSRYAQTIILLHHLHRQYFERLDVSAFPESYQSEIKELKFFLGSLSLSKQEALLRENKSGTRQAHHFLSLLAAKKREGTIDAFREKLFRFEALLSMAKGIEKHNYVFPEISDSILSVTGLRHPLLPEAVPYDFTGKKPVVVISGPNMSGKSTFLKAVSLMVYLSHLGMAVPAQKCVVPIYDKFYFFFQHSDKLSEGYSHFMQEIMQLKAVVEAANAGQKCLAIFDELFRGTNETDALSVSEQTMKGLTRFEDSLFFISTHLQGLKETVLQENNAMQACCFGCQLADGLPVFDYRLQVGWSEVGIGQLLFEKEGLPALLGSPKNMN